MQDQAVAEAPRWITIIALASCSLVAICVLLIAVVSGYLIARKGGANSREVAELREENARLREEVEQLRKGQSEAGSTGIKAM
jgi:hypothetical protein